MTEKDCLSVCSALLGTLTSAQKAQKTLAAAAIPTRIIKLPNAIAHRGCVWGIEFSCNQRENIEMLLTGAGIGVRRWSNDIPR